MGIKFLGSNTTGRKPTTAQLGEREIAFNLADKALFTNDGTNIIEIKMGGGTSTYVPGQAVKKGALITDGTGQIVYVAPVAYTAGTLPGDIAAGSLVPISIATKTVPWVTATTYKAGSMVYGSNGEGLFVVSGDYTSGATIAADVTGNKLVPAVTIPKEQGGTKFRTNVNYKAGDIVTDATGVAWVVKTDFTSGLNFDFTKFTKVSIEKGGVDFSSARLYAIGDIVTDSGVVYHCVNAVTTAGPFKAADWEAVGVPEVGGREFNTASTYAKGDVATDDFDVYVALGANTGVALTDKSKWHHIDDVLHSEGTFTPAAGAEYPTGGAEGGVWHVTGLGVDAAGNPVGYAMTGGTMSGTTVVDNDEIIWINSDNAGATVWYLRQYPKHVTEKGGMAFNTAKDYVVGDIVSNAGETLIANKAVAAGSAFVAADFDSTSPKERVGIAWIAATAYLADDVVVVDDGGSKYIVRRIAAGTSGATFDAAEKALWSVDIIADPGTY